MDHHHHRSISATRSDGVVESDGVGQGKLYSPDHAIKISEKPNNNPEGSSDSERDNTMLGTKNLAAVKDKVLEKLAAASVPAESLENAKQFLESVMRDVAGAAHGITKDALHRIKTHIADIFPSVSPAVTKIVDDAEKEAVNREGEECEKKSKESGFVEKSPYVSPTSSFFGSLAKPFSRL